MYPVTRLLNWFTNPNVPPSVNKRNFVNVQIDAVGIGLAGAAGPFLPIFLTRSGASSFQISLLTSMPAVTGLLLALLIGRFLQTRRQIVPWFSAARLTVVLCYTLTGLAPFIFPTPLVVPAVLGIWAFATIPQTVVAIAFSVVMNAVAGPASRYELMTRRWSILGLTTSISTVVAGQMLDRIHATPLNYQIVFLCFSLGGFISYYFSSHINLPDAEPVLEEKGVPILQQIKDYAALVRIQKPFVSFVTKRFIFIAGTTLTAPVFPLYYVNKVHATDAWIGIISTCQSALLILGYFIWSRQSRRRGGRFVLLCTTLGIALHPALVSLTHDAPLIALFAAFAGFFQAGLDLVFFDELMKTFPPEYSATFVSIGQALQYMSTIASPMIGSVLSDSIGLEATMLISAAVRLAGFLLFFGLPRLRRPGPSPAAAD